MGDDASREAVFPSATYTTCRRQILCDNFLGTVDITRGYCSVSIGRYHHHRVRATGHIICGTRNPIGDSKNRTMYFPRQSTQYGTRNRTFMDFLAVSTAVPKISGNYNVFSALANPNARRSDPRNSSWSLGGVCHHQPRGLEFEPQPVTTDRDYN